MRLESVCQCGVQAAMFAAGWLFCGPVWGQTGVPSIERTLEPARKVEDRTGSTRYWISRSDCLKDDAFTFTLSVRNTGQRYLLEVWSGISDSCLDDGYRLDSSRPWCQIIYSGLAEDGTVELVIPVRDIVARKYSVDRSRVVHAGAEVCSPEDSTTGTPEDVTLSFVLVEESGKNVSGASPLTWSTKIDLAGPRAPDGLRVGVGEGALFLHWNALNSSDVQGYKLFCAPRRVEPLSPAQDAAGGSGAGLTGGAAGSLASSVAGGQGAPAAGAGADTSAVEPGQAGATSSADAGQQESVSTCSSALLVPGKIPETGECADVPGSLQTRGTATSLMNGIEYAVGVAAYDLVGNVGPLSELVCATPTQVDDFFERYRRAGGRGGGGFCTVTGSTRIWPAWLVGVSGLLWSLRKRRRGS